MLLLLLPSWAVSVEEGRLELYCKDNTPEGQKSAKNWSFRANLASVRSCFSKQCHVSVREKYLCLICALDLKLNTNIWACRTLYFSLLDRQAAYRTRPSLFLEEFGQMS